MKTAILNGREIDSREALHASLARQLRFPEHYGRNLDALYDLLTESPGDYCIRVTDAEDMEASLGAYYSAFLRVLEDAGIAGVPGTAVPGEDAPDQYTDQGETEPDTKTRRIQNVPSCNHTAVDLSLLEPTLQAYADVRGSLISILQKTQEIYGYVPIDAVYEISERTGLSPAKILGVATFYSQFRFQPIGKYLILLCKGTACYVNGAERVIDVITDELGIGNNETTEDGLFSLSVVSCLGCCSLAPVMMINDKTYGSLTPEKIRKTLRDLRKEAEAQ